MLNVTQLVGFGVGGDVAAAINATYIFGGYDYANSTSRNYATQIDNVTLTHTEKNNLGANISNGTGFGSNEVGYGTGGTASYKRDYATDTATSGSTLTINAGQGWAAFNLTRAIVSPNVGSSTTKYTYAGDVSASGTSLTYSNADNYAGGTCNATYGYFTGSSGSDTTTTKYTFSSDTAAAGSTMYQASNARDLMNSNTHGYRMDTGVGLGSSSTMRKWSYSAETESSSTAAISRSGYGATGIGGDSTTGLMQAGFTTYYSVYDKIYKFVMSTEVLSETTALTNDRYGGSIASSNAGAMV
jgi:hypothetical protein